MLETWPALRTGFEAMCIGIRHILQFSQLYVSKTWFLANRTSRIRYRYVHI